MQIVEKEMQFLEELLANHFNWIFRDRFNQLVVARSLGNPIHFDENYVIIGDEDNSDFPYITAFPNEKAHSFRCGMIVKSDTEYH